MSMLNNISQEEQRQAEAQRKDALKKIKERKLDTRRKIEWGGLIVKSKMSQYSKDIILGALIVACDQIHQSKNMEILFQEKGANAFRVNTVDR